MVESFLSNKSRCSEGRASRAAREDRLLANDRAPPNERLAPLLLRFIRKLVIIDTRRVNLKPIGSLPQPHPRLIGSVSV
jgi:hypothetical protein